MPRGRTRDEHLPGRGRSRSPYDSDHDDDRKYRERSYSRRRPHSHSRRADADATDLSGVFSVLDIRDRRTSPARHEHPSNAITDGLSSLAIRPRISSSPHPAPLNHSGSPYVPKSRQPPARSLQARKNRLVELHGDVMGLCPCQLITQEVEQDIEIDQILKDYKSQHNDELLASWDGEVPKLMEVVQIYAARKVYKGEDVEEDYEEILDEFPEMLRYIQMVDKYLRTHKCRHLLSRLAIREN